MKLSNVVRGVREKEKINIVAWLKYVDHGGAYPTEIVVCNPSDEGSFPVHHSLAQSEVVVDREKMANIILFELQAGKWQLVNTLVNSGDVVDIAQAIATAIEKGEIISLKEGE